MDTMRHISPGAVRPLQGVVSVGAALAITVLAAAGCVDDATAPDVLGEWGAPHVALVLTDDGGTLEYDCAHGTVGPGWKISSEGRLTATGTHVEEHGGPVREDEDVMPRPAGYDGLLRGDDLRLTVTLTDSARVLGTFDLKRGQTGPVFKCL